METTLLFVEKSPHIAAAISTGIYELKPDWKIFTASSCREAKDIINEQLPCAAVLDMGLPDGDGFELLEELRDKEPRLPVIMISGKTTVDLEPGNRNGHPFRLMGKPFAISEIIEEMEKELHSACLVSQSNNGKKKVPDAIPMRGCTTVALARIPEKRQLSVFYF